MNRSKVLCSITAIVLIVIGLPLVATGCRNLWDAYASPSWPTAPGKIKNSRVQEYLTGTSTSRNRTTTFWASIVFEYSVDGQKYISDTVYLGDSSGSADSSEAEALHLRYPNDAIVNVYYNRTNPAIAVLEPGIQSDIFWLPGIGLIFLLPGVAFWIARWMFCVEHGWVNLFGNLIATGLFFAGVAMLARGVGNLKLGRESMSWPVVEGIMICSPLEPEDSTLLDQEHREEQRKASGGASHSTGLVYEYDVQNRKRYGSVLRFGGLSLSNYKEDPEFIRRYAVRKQVKVAYSRDDPALSALEPGVFYDAYWIPAIGAFLFLSGLAIGLFAIPTLARIRVGSAAPEAPEWLRKMREQESK